jgi:hypothetical protein
MLANIIIKLYSNRNYSVLANLLCMSILLDFPVRSEYTDAALFSLFALSIRSTLCGGK